MSTRLHEGIAFLLLCTQIVCVLNTHGISAGEQGEGTASTGLGTGTADISTATGASALCGNGIVEDGEECDSGRANAASAVCTPYCKKAVCGDGFVLDGIEVCDDGNTLPIDGCESDCTMTSVVKVVGGGNNTCALFSTGHIRCWGYNQSGQLGYGTTDDIGDDENIGTVGAVNMGGAVESVSLGGSHTCAVLVGGALRCWGFNISGKLGLGHGYSVKDMVPSDLPEVQVGGTVKQVSAGHEHTCAVLMGGKLRCWGNNEVGQLGLGHSENIGDDQGEMPPPDVSVGGSVLQVTTGAYHTCALLEGGNVRCWGKSVLGFPWNGPFGNDEGEVPSSVEPINLGGPAVQIEAISNSTCALMGDGLVRCWGLASGGQIGYWNTDGIVGDDEAEMPPPPLQLGGPTVDIFSGGVGLSGNRCFLLEGGRVKCFGDGASFCGDGPGLGYGDKEIVGDDQGEMPPPDVELGGTVIQLGKGAEHACAIINGGHLRCWGCNSRGALGYGNTENIGDQPGEMPPPDVQVF